MGEEKSLEYRVMTLEHSLPSVLRSFNEVSETSRGRDAALDKRIEALAASMDDLAYQFNAHLKSHAEGPFSKKAVISAINNVAAEIAALIAYKKGAEQRINAQRNITYQPPTQPSTAKPPYEQWVDATGPKGPYQYIRAVNADPTLRDKLKENGYYRDGEYSYWLFTRGNRIGRRRR